MTCLGHMRVQDFTLFRHGQPGSGSKRKKSIWTPKKSMFQEQALETHPNKLPGRWLRAGESSTVWSKTAFAIALSFMREHESYLLLLSAAQKLGGSRLV